MKTKNLLLFFFSIMIFYSSLDFVINQLSPIKGLLCYHHYDYSITELLLYNFTDNTLISLSSNWNTYIIDSKFCHINPKTGNSLVFTGKNIEHDKWGIYYIEDIKKFVNEPYLPSLITDFDLSSHDEYPKWDFKGEKIVFIRNLISIVEIEIKTRISNVLFSEPESELSMPFYNKNGTKIVYCKGGKTMLSIHVYDIEKNTSKVLYDRDGIQDYYPTTFINKTSGEEKLLFISWISQSNRYDQM